MATYISFLRFTESGVHAIGDTTKRAADFKAAAKKLGAKVHEIYWTLGTYDGLVIFDAPNEETATAAMLQVSAKGMVHTSTSRAFVAAEMDKVLAKLPKK